MSGKKFLGGCSAISVAIFCSGAALSQTTAPAAGSSAEPVALEDIVVTAQKRAEPLQNVPIAINALTGDMLENRGVNSTDSLVVAVPSLELPRTYTSQTPFIRGIGTANSAPGDESANAIYIDGVYRPSLPGGIFTFSGVERVEVLKGPQGTLFGRNALGGVINVITRDPSFEPSVDVEVGYGNYRTVEGSFYGTTGLSQNLAASLSAYYKDQGKGFAKNIFNGREVLKGKDVSLRGKLLWRSEDERTQAVFSADYEDNHADSGYVFHAFGDALLVGGVANTDFYEVNTNILDPKGHTEQYGFSLNLSHEMDWAKFVSISAYRKVKPLLVTDQDGSPSSVVNIIQDSPQRTISQELQLVSPDDSKINWVLGLYYWDDITTQSLFLNGAAFGALTFRNTFATQKSKSYAGFAQTTIPLTDATNFTAGLRYTVDKRHITGFWQTLPSLFPPNGIIPTSIADDRSKFPKLTWRFVLDHHFTEDLMVYGSVSRGFKSGLYSMVTPAEPPVRPSTMDAYEVGFKSQLFDNRVRLNGAAFYYRYKDIQLRSVTSGQSILINAAAATMKGAELDMDAAVTRNFRLQGSMTYLHGRYTDFPNAPFFIPRVNASGVPVGGNIRVVSPNAEGQTMIDAPTFSASAGAQYDIPTEIGLFNLSANVSYNSGAFRDPDNRIKNSPRTLVNGTIGWTSPEENLDIKIWGRNLTGEKYCSYATGTEVGDLCSPAPPRTYGATLGFHF